MRLGQLLRRLEGLAIQIDRLAHEARREMRGKGERQPHRRCQLRAEQAGTKQPQRHLQARAGHRAQALAGARGVEIRLQLRHILRKGIGRVLRGAAAQRAGGGLVGAGRAAQAKIDAAGKQRGERAELFGHHQRRVVRQHDAARAHANGGRAVGDIADQHRGGGAGDAGHIVMLGQPEAAIAQALGVLRQRQRIAHGLAGISTFHDGRQIKQGIGDHGFPWGRHALSMVSTGPRQIIERSL